MSPIQEILDAAILLFKDYPRRKAACEEQTQLRVDVLMSDEDQTLSLPDLCSRFLEPMMSALAARTPRDVVFLELECSPGLESAFLSKSGVGMRATRGKRLVIDNFEKFKRFTILRFDILVEPGHAASCRENV